MTDFDGNFKSRECVANNPESEMLPKLQSKLLQLGEGQMKFGCSIFDQEITANRADANTMFWLEGTRSYSPEQMSFVVAGFYDSKADPDEVLATMRLYYLNGYNSIAEVGLEYDTKLDLSNTFQFTESLVGERKKLYRATVNQAPVKMLNHDTEGSTSPVMVRFSIGSFLGRHITLRKKSFMEVWREIGGCWASALLLVGIFYVRRSTTRRDGSSVDTQVLRFRGEHSKIEMLKELKAYWEDHSDAVQDVTGKSVPDPETGVAAVCAGTPVGTPKRV